MRSHDAWPSKEVKPEQVSGSQIRHNLATDQNGQDRTIEGFCGFQRMAFCGKNPQNGRSYCKNIFSKPLIYLVERATGVEPATFSLGSYFRISNIRYLVRSRHRPATSRRKHARKNACRLRDFFCFLKTNKMPIDVQRHSGVFMAHSFLYGL